MGNLTLEELISKPTLEALAGQRSFERGLAYFRGGAVTRLTTHRDRITARVAGTEVYLVKLWPDRKFQSAPALSTYQQLKEGADRTDNWKIWREKALLTVREQASQSHRSRVHTLWRGPLNGVLAEIYLREGSPGNALTVARTGGCPDHVWIRIAKDLESTNPNEAIAIYQERIDPIVRRTDNQAYEEAARLLERINLLLTRTSRGSEFRPYLESLRARHKAKRNFLQRIAGVAPAGPTG